MLEKTYVKNFLLPFGTILLAHRPTTLNANSASLRKANSPDHTALLNLQKELQEERNTVAGLEKERDFYFGKLRDIEVMIQQEMERSPDQAENQLLKEIQAVLYSTEVQ